MDQTVSLAHYFLAILFLPSFYSSLFFVLSFWKSKFMFIFSSHLHTLVSSASQKNTKLHPHPAAEMSLCLFVFRSTFRLISLSAAAIHVQSTCTYLLFDDARLGDGWVTASMPQHGPLYLLTPTAMNSLIINPKWKFWTLLMPWKRKEHWSYFPSTCTVKQSSQVSSSQIDLESLFSSSCEELPSFCFLPIFHGVASFPLADNRSHLIKAKMGRDGPGSRASPLNVEVIDRSVDP